MARRTSKDVPVAPLAASSDLYYRMNDTVYGPIKVDIRARSIRVLTTAGDAPMFPLTERGLTAATRQAVRSARVGREWAGAIDRIQTQPACGGAAGCPGSLVR